MVSRVTPPSAVRAIVDESGRTESSFRAFLQIIALRALVIGQGNPESAIEAVQGALYMDESAETGDCLYIKRLADIGGDKTKGWRAI